MSKKSRKPRRNRNDEKTLFIAGGTEPIPSVADILKQFGGEIGSYDDDEKTESAKPEKKRKPKKQRNIGSEPGDREPVGLRIIGGSCRGRKLTYAGNNLVRPMKDRTREAVFNLIGPPVKGKYVIDLFAGTGALAFEALSRGAERALMIELHLPTAKNIRLNLESLGMKEKCEIITSDTFYWAQTREGLDTELPWLVFCSPPYDFYVTRADEMIDMLRTLVEIAPEESVFAIESDDRFDFATLPFEIHPRKRRTYAPAEIGIFFK